MPTVVPTTEFSNTNSASVSMSAIELMSNSLISLTAIVKLRVELDPSTLEARTVMMCEDDCSKFSNEPSATDISPVIALMLNRPFESSSSEYVTALVVASASKANAVIPTTVPFATFSLTVLAVALVSVSAVTLNSFASTMAMEKV